MGAGSVLAEEVDQRHQHQPGEDAAGKDDARRLGADDVAHAQVLRRGVGLDGRAFQHVLRAEVGLELRRARPCAEEVLILEEGVERAQAEAEEDAAGKRAAVLAGHQHVGAGRALGEVQVAVLLHDQLPPQRNHEEHAQKAADQRQHEDARVLQIEAQKDQRRQREDDARGNRLAGVAGGLDDDVLQNRGSARRRAEC